jgi:hypothetical protein
MNHRKPKPGWGDQETRYSYYRLLVLPEGGRERELKLQLIEYFRTEHQIEAAYLAWIEFVNKVRTGMCLALRAREYTKQPPILEKIGDIYASLYRIEEHMDVIFIKEKRERDVLKLMQPFYGKPYQPKAEDAHLATTAIVCPHCASKKYGILQAMRTASYEKGDSGWQFHCKSGLSEDLAEMKILPLKEVLDLDPSLRKWLRSPAGTTLWRTSSRAPWEDLNKPTAKPAPPSGSPASLNGEHRASENPHPFGETEEDSIRQYLALKPNTSSPFGIDLYYECLGCGCVLHSVPAQETKCRCGNITAQPGRVTIKALAKARVFRQR